MKILHVITKSDLGGAQVFVLNLARAFKDGGHTIKVAAGDGDYLFNELEKIGIEYFYLNSLKRDFSFLNAIKFVFELRKLLKKEKFDIVHLNSSNTLIGAFTKYLINSNPKYVFTFHGLSFIDSNFKTNVWLKALSHYYFKIFLASVDKTVFECKLNHDEILKRNIVKKGNIIYNGIDVNYLNYLSKEKVREYFSSICNADLSNSFLIGSTGRLAYQKNYEFLIDSFFKAKQLISNAKLIIIGDGPLQKFHFSHIKKLGLERDVFLVGMQKDSFQYMKGFDVFTLTSRYEGVSISLIEAVFAEIAILATNVGGNPEVVGNDEKQLFNLNDQDDYLNKLLYIKGNRDKIVQHNSKLKSFFTLENMVHNYEILYRN